MSPRTPEADARRDIDRQLAATGWIVQDRAAVNVHAGPGVAVREFPTASGPVDYLLYVDGAGAGAVEAKRVGFTLSGVEGQSQRYGAGLPPALPVYRRPLPFLFESTGVETWFTNLMDPEPRSRELFTFHRPETLRRWLGEAGYGQSVRSLPTAAETPAGYEASATLRHRLRNLPDLATEGLWPAQIKAIRNLEASFADNRQRALIQMATGSGKTYTACNSIYRLAKFAKAHRVLFLVDRANLGRQAYKEFSQFVTPDDGRKFTELYVVQHLHSNSFDSTAKVTISTIQRLYSILRGDAELPEELDESSAFTAVTVPTRPVEIAYNPAIPIDAFDFIVTDECHRSIYGVWRQVLEYFDAFVIGLTATPSAQTLGFFHRNLVMEYDHAQAVADGVNVDFDVYEIHTEITEQGSKIDAGLYVDRRDRLTRRRRWERLDDDLPYDASELDRAVVAEDQLRTVVRAFRDRLFTEIFPGRTEVPKTLVFAKDDSHAEDLVRVIREEFGKGNDFCQKITYRTTGAKPEDLLASFRNSYNPRIAVTVDMIATGTDVKPLEIVFFMRSVRSRTFFEQMKGRGVRVINATDLQAVTPDAVAKTRFVIVDAVGVSHEDLADTTSLEKQPSVPFERLLEQVAFGNRDEEILSSLTSRLTRLDHRLTHEDRRSLEEIAGGRTLHAIMAALIDALDPDRQLDAARATTGSDEPTAEQVADEARRLLDEAVKPIATNPALRSRLIEIRQSYEQTIDTTSIDRVLRAGYSTEATEAARGIVTSFEMFIRDHADEIAALEVLFSRPYARRLSFADVRELAEAIGRPPRAWTPDLLWAAYERLDHSKVRGSGERTLADLVSLVRYAVHDDDELTPYADRVAARFDAWLAIQRTAGRAFTEEQLRWLRMIRDQISASLGVELDDFAYVPFNQEGGVGRAFGLFGADLAAMLDELNQELTA